MTKKDTENQCTSNRNKYYYYLFRSDLGGVIINYLKGKLLLNLRYLFSVRDNPKEILAWISNTNEASYFSLAVHGQTFFRLNYPLKLNKWVCLLQHFNANVCVNTRAHFLYNLEFYGLNFEHTFKVRVVTYAAPPRQ